MLTFLLCDDNLADLQRLKDMLAMRYSADRISVFSNPDEVLQYYQSGGVFHVALLDILMPQMNGTELAHSLREAGYGGYILFLTTSNEFATQSYDVQAFDYLLKPVDAERFNVCLSRLEADLAKNDMAGMTITVGRAAQRVFFRDLVVAEARNHQVRLLLRDGRELAPYMTLRDCAALLLKDERFAYCHNSYIVNMDYVETLTARTVLLRGGERITISRSYADFQTQCIRRLMEKGYGK